MNVLSLSVGLVPVPGRGGKRDIQSQWPTTRLLHDLIDILGLQLMLEERIVEELPMDLGDLSLGVSISVVSGSREGKRRDFGDLRCGVLSNRDLLYEVRGSGLRDAGRVGFRSRGLLRGWGVSGDGGDALSGEPHFGCLSAVNHLVGVRVDESGVEETSGGEV